MPNHEMIEGLIADRCQSLSDKFDDEVQEAAWKMIAELESRMNAQEKGFERETIEDFLLDVDADKCREEVSCDADEIESDILPVIRMNWKYQHQETAP